MRKFKKKEKRTCECPYCGRREQEAMQLNRLLKALSCDFRVDIYKALEDESRQEILSFLERILDDGVSSNKFKERAQVYLKNLRTFCFCYVRKVLIF